MNFSQEKRIYRVFIISVTMAILFCLSAVFLCMAIRSRDLIYEELVARGRAHFYGILMVRKWNASYGGVYVEKKDGVESNPFLKDADIVTTEGRVFTKRNPALMSAEISKFCESEELFRFHPTSLKPLNPHNRPDDFEREALLAFERGEKEAFRIEARKFRYLAPVYVEQDCMPCHVQQGYKVGDIRGGITVSFDVQNMQEKLRKNFTLIIIFGIATAVLLLSSVHYFVSKLHKSLTLLRLQIEEMAVTDSLTGVFNRGHIMRRLAEEFTRAKRQGKRLSCVLFDIDHFKRVNDDFGHLAGDEVLRSLTAIVLKSTRTYDILGRYGGEEFLLVLPDTNRDMAIAIAERLRLSIRKGLVIPLRPSLSGGISISLGVAFMAEADKSPEDLLKRADEALYHAKESGRDRVEIMD